MKQTAVCVCGTRNSERNKTAVAGLSVPCFAAAGCRRSATVAVLAFAKTEIKSAVFVYIIPTIDPIPFPPFRAPPVILNGYSDRVFFVIGRPTTAFIYFWSFYGRMTTDDNQAYSIIQLLSFNYNYQLLFEQNSTKCFLCRINIY